MIHKLIAVFVSIRGFVHDHEKNVEWILLLMGSIALAILGVYVANDVRKRFSPRSHNGVKLFNDFLARQHLSYFMFFITLIIKGSLGDLGNYSALVLAIMSLAFYNAGVSQATELGEKTLHEQCSGPNCTDHIPFFTRLRFCRRNIIFVSISLPLAVIYAFLAH